MIYFNTWSLIGNIFQRNWQYTEKWFCSELVSAAFKSGNKDLLDARTNRITPGDLLECDLLVSCNKEDIR